MGDENGAFDMSLRKVTTQTLQFIAKHLVCIAIVCGILSVIARYFEIATFLVNILENVCVALLVSGFILRYIEKQDREIFHHEIINVQKQTAQDAIQSVFQRLIDKNTFEMIQKDIFQGKFVRKNVTWDYIITKKDNGQIVLKRVVSYKLKNITMETQTEKFSVISDNTGTHCTLETKTKIGYNGKLEYLQSSETTLEIRPQEEIDVVTEMIEKFNSQLDYVYTAHCPRFGIIGLNVNFPEEYEFKIIVIAFSSGLEKIHESDGKHIYETKNAIYKGQAIEFVCYPKADKANQSSVSQQNTNPKDTK